MSKLDELINTFCPEGVEYKKLKEVATISRGGSFQKKDYVEDGFPCIHYGQIYTLYSLFVNETANYISNEIADKQKKAETNDVIMAVTSENMEDVCKCVAWLGEGEVAVSGHTAIIHHTLDPKYLVYWLHSSMFYTQKVKLAHGTKVMEVKPDSLGDVILPVPPKEVQSEIVRVLDQLTELTTKLTAELTAEHVARKKQYIYYRSALFNFGEEVPTVGLEDISENCDSQRRPVTKGNRTAGVYPYYGASGIVDYVDDYIFDGDYLLISEDGANLLARVTPIAFPITGKNWVNNHAHILKFNDWYDQRFVEIYLNGIDLSKFISGAAQPKLNQKNLNSIPIPYPPREERVRIVRILDNYERFCNDISNSLNTEAEARQKQYAYYRDNLLTFRSI